MENAAPAPAPVTAATINSTAAFRARAEEVLDLAITHRVNRLGGYGPAGEVIYEAHPQACPSVLVDNKGPVSVTFMSNGSLDLKVKRDDGMTVQVLRGHFDQFEKREIGVPSANVWLWLEGKRTTFTSLMSPRMGSNADPEWIKLVKLGDPERAFWYCAAFHPRKGVRFVTAVRLTLVMTDAGPAVARQVYIKNTGKKRLKGTLMPFFDLRGTQLFVYNKEIWYDMGLPLDRKETVIAATVPYRTTVQVKRISSRSGGGITAGDATCDYLSFVGDSGANTCVPAAVRQGRLLDTGGRQAFNRFSTPTIYAQEFAVNIPFGGAGTMEQSLLYLTDERIAQGFRKAMQSRLPDYRDMARSFKKAARGLAFATPGIAEVASKTEKRTATAEAHPAFMLRLPAQPAVQEYANSVWTGVEELYENCRAHGAKMAQGIEIGTRDRGQDMWPKLKEDPGRVRADLVHLFSFMYYHTDENLDHKDRYSLREKIHGMFPRQYPSRWDNRSEKLPNDNRPYADSALWPIDSIVRYITETGDHSILLERVKTVRLTEPDTPITSGMVGHDREFFVAEIIFEVLASFERQAKESPYGMVQTLYGDWCDPIDMYGTDPVGDPLSRGRGRGTNTRLAAHAFLNAVAAVDLMEVPAIAALVGSRIDLAPRVERVKRFADRLRKNIVRWAWEDDAFIDYIQEFRRDGSHPDYGRGETGYTLGSVQGRDFDGLKRRLMTPQAWALMMLVTDRPWLAPVDGRDSMVKKLLAAVEKVFYDRVLGLKLLTPPIANNEASLKYVGRIGIVPAGTAENGEYHHGQTMMHLFRLALPGQADAVWREFTPIMSATRGEDLNGPFETPSTSYASDKYDPHFGAGMYFGLSGSTDWIVNIFEQIAGLQLNLHDARKPALAVKPNLPAAIDERLTYKRYIHLAQPGGYRRIPFTLVIGKRGDTAKKLAKTEIRVNGKPAAVAEIADLREVKEINIQITYIHA
ncbi:MAG: hypothetical protein ABIF71_06285 [Planctomycetota bacterium]